MTSATGVHPADGTLLELLPSLDRTLTHTQFLLGNREIAQKKALFLEENVSRRYVPVADAPLMQQFQYPKEFGDPAFRLLLGQAAMSLFRAL